MWSPLRRVKEARICSLWIRSAWIGEGCKAHLQQISEIFDKSQVRRPLKPNDHGPREINPRLLIRESEIANMPFLGALAECNARRSERRVASHTSEDQRRNAPFNVANRAATHGILAFSASLSSRTLEKVTKFPPGKSAGLDCGLEAGCASTGQRVPWLLQIKFVAWIWRSGDFYAKIYALSVVEV